MVLIPGLHVVGGLEFEGGGDGEDATAKGGGTEEKPGKEVGLEWIIYKGKGLVGMGNWLGSCHTIAKVARLG